MTEVTEGAPVDWKGARKAIAPFMRPSNALALASIARVYLVTGFCVWLAERLHHPLATLAAMALIAGWQVGLYSSLHTASHGVLFHPGAWNTRLEILFSYPILSTVGLYWPSHRDHHREISTRVPTALDYFVHEYGLREDGPWRRTWRGILLPLSGHAGVESVVACYREIRQDPREGVRLAAFWLSLVTLCALTGHLRLLGLYWVLPRLWLVPAYLTWTEISDHFGSETGTRNHLGLFQWLIGIHGRHHALHHRFPQVPFYHERRANAALEARGVTLETTETLGDFLRFLYGKHRPLGAAPHLDEQGDAP